MGLPPGASPAQVKRRYRQLVKQWHPDRFGSDPVNQAEATERLAHYNAAYHLLTAEGEDPQSSAPPPRAPSAPSGRTTPTAPSPTTRLSREQIESIVRSIGTDSPLDGLLSWFERTAYPNPDLEAVHPTPAAVMGALLVAVVVIGLDLRYGRIVAYPTLLAAAWVAVLVSRRAKPRR